MTEATRYTVKELRGMGLGALAEIGEDLGLKFGKNHTRAERAKRILAAYAERDLAKDPSRDLDRPPFTAADRATPGEPKPGFERLIDGAAEDGEIRGNDQTPHWGGERPGAGRPEGMTDEIAAYNRLSKQPHPAIKQALEKLFEKWSKSVGCAEIKLTKDEAFALALPWTQAYELSPWHGKIPPWLMVAIACAWTTWAVFDTKSEIARQYAHRRRLGLTDAPKDATFEPKASVN